MWVKMQGVRRKNEEETDPLREKPRGCLVQGGNCRTVPVPQTPGSASAYLIVKWG
jgi:hypothetical protein